MGHVVDKVRVGLVVLQSTNADEVPACHSVMHLRRRQHRVCAGLAQLQAMPKPQRLGSAQGVGIEARPLPKRPARQRPYPRCTVTVSSAWPGMIHTGACRVRPW